MRTSCISNAVSIGRRIALLFIVLAAACVFAMAANFTAFAIEAPTGSGAPAGPQNSASAASPTARESAILDNLAVQAGSSVETDASFYVQLGQYAQGDEAPIECMPYTGKPVEPTIGGYSSGLIGMTLTEGEHFKVTYENNVEPGEATAIIEGIGAWEGKTSLTFKIVKIDPQWKAYGVYGNEFGLMVDAAWTPPTEGFYPLPDMVRVVRSEGGVPVDVLKDLHTPFPNMMAFLDGFTWTIENELANHVLRVYDADTHTYGLVSLDDGSMLVEFGKYNWMSFGVGLSDVVGTWIDGNKAGVDYFDSDCKIVASFSTSSNTATPQNTYIRYGADNYPYDMLSVVLSDKNGAVTRQVIYIEKTAKGFVEHPEWTEPPAYPSNPDEVGGPESEQAEEIYASAWWSTERYELPDGTKLRYHIVRNDKGMPTADMVVVDADGKQVVLGEGTLGLYPTFFQEQGQNGFFASVASPQATSQLRNSVKHAGMDMWWATNKNGKWGAVDSKGTVIVPFEHEAYGDRGLEDTDSVLVKVDGNWRFFPLRETGPEKPEGTPRLAGNSALDTMSAIVNAGHFEQGGTVVLAQFEGYWDALTAAGIAGLEDAPVLMTFTASLAPQTQALLEALKPAKIIVCGGEGSLPKATVEAAAKAAGTNPEIVRCAGDTAVGTAIDIYQQGTDGKGSGWADTALIATVGTFQDALAAAPVAYAQKMPIFLASYDWVAEKGTLSKETIDAMVKGGIKKAYIAGGEYWIAKDVEKQLKDAKIEFGGRLSGNNAMETSEQVANLAVDELGMTAEALGLATVNSYYDALCGAPLCGRLDSVMLLVSDANSPSITSFVAKHAKDIKGVWVFGGDGTIDADTLAAVNKALGK